MLNMSEKRKPKIKFTIEFGGKRLKLELFEESLYKEPAYCKGKRYRLRANGHWHGGICRQMKFFTIYQIRDMIFKGMSVGGII
jgi:hypothetical protein